MAVNITSVIVTSAVLGFSGGQIASVNVSYTVTGAGGTSWSGQHTWQLTPAEQTATTGFVTALENHLATALGLTISTT
jgi:hypothetical protein